MLAGRQRQILPETLLAWPRGLWHLRRIPVLRQGRRDLLGHATPAGEPGADHEGGEALDRRDPRIRWSAHRQRRPYLESGRFEEESLTEGRTTDEKGTDKAQAIRRSQQKDRSRILQEIQQSQTTLARYSEERAPLSNELKKTEADVGPIKYIAALLYDQAVDADILDKAVRLVILLIIVVFDPLAVLLLIAANSSLQQNKRDYDEYRPDPWVADVGERPTKEEKEEIEIPVFVPKDESIKVDKNNLAKIVIDDATGESIPPITSPVKKLEPKYNYDDPYAFREKEK